MNQETMKKIQMLEMLCGTLRGRFGYSLEADEVFNVLSQVRDYYLLTDKRIPEHSLTVLPKSEHFQSKEQFMKKWTDGERE